MPLFISIFNGTDLRARLPTSIASFITTMAISAVVVWAAYVLCVVSLLDQHAVILRGNKNVIDAKLSRLKSPNRPPHLIIVSGSNAYYSVDSDALSASTGMPVTNAALQISYTMYMLDHILDLVKPGDLVLLPLEYEYFTSIDEYPPLESCHYLTQERQALKGLPDYVFALTKCNPSVTFDGLRLLLFAKAGFRGPSYEPRDMMTDSGDILENVPSAASYHQPRSSTIIQPSKKFDRPRISRQILALVAKDVRVFLTYPVKPAADDPNLPVVDLGWTAAYMQLGESLGATVISTPQAHVFPVECFFDSGYHLHRGCTAQNSAKYAEALRPYLTGK